MLALTKLCAGPKRVISTQFLALSFFSTAQGISSSFVDHFKASSTLGPQMVVRNCWDNVFLYSQRTEKERVLVSEFLAKVLRFIQTSLTLVTYPTLKQSL